MTSQEISMAGEFPLLPATIQQTAEKVFDGFSTHFRQLLNGRQERALKLALGGHVTHKAQRVFSVRSEDGKHGYLVNLDEGTCTCPDNRSGFVCKHRIAAYLIEQSLAAAEVIARKNTQDKPEDKVEAARLVLNAKSDLLHEAIIYAIIQHEGQPLPIEVISLEGEVAVVRALPMLEGEKLVPCFPFENRASSAKVLASSLLDITIYR